MKNTYIVHEKYIYNTCNCIYHTHLISIHVLYCICIFMYLFTGIIYESTPIINIYMGIYESIRINFTITCPICMLMII